MNKRIEIVKKIDNILGEIINTGNNLINLAETVEYKELKTKILECSIILATQVQDINTFLIMNLKTYMNKDIDDKEWQKIIKQLEDKNE